MTARAALKRATRDVHDRLDASLSTCRLDQAEGYADFLAVQAAAYLPIERALTKSGAADVVPDWNVGLRGTKLVDDLAALGRAVPPEVVPPTYDGEAALLGGIYVIEGSRMGAAVLAKQVPPALPRAFLSARPPAGWWSVIVAILERKLCSTVERDLAEAAARRTFACFEQAAGPDQSI